LLRFQERTARFVKLGQAPEAPKPHLRLVAARQQAHKIADKLRPSVKDAEDQIQAVLTACDTDEQLERDVALWYGYCADGSKGAQVCLRLFTAMKSAGVLYKKPDGTWGDFGLAFPSVPVASLLSHGGRILFLLPPSDSALRQIASTVGAFVKGVTIDPLAATFGRGSFHTLRGKSTAAAVVGHGLLRATGLAAAASVLSVGHKMQAAGDDTLFHYFSAGQLHSRALATHSTIECDPERAEKLPRNRRLWFTEEKAQGGTHHLSNIRDGMMGRHYYKNVALGGIGNINPFSGVTIDKAGGHGHLYVNYRAPRYGRFGCMLVGVEGSAPGVSDQTGKVHDAKATKGLWSPTGSKKWQALYPNRFFDPQDKNDVTQFVCDLSDRSALAVLNTFSGKVMAADNLHAPIAPVRQAVWQ
jgi:hypothetical protein